MIRVKMARKKDVLDINLAVLEEGYRLGLNAYGRKSGK
jgi:hypothetical protein